MKDALNRNLEEAFRFWAQIVDMGGQSSDLESMNELALYMKGKFADLGLKCSFLETGENNPPVLLAESAETDRKPILFSGHYDTVFPFSGYAHPAFRVDADAGKAYGPGVLDMKGGIAIIWLILKTLKDLQRMPAVRVVLAGDEETDRIGCRTEEILRKITAGCRFAFNMETGTLDRAVCIGRKGVEEYEVTVTGISSHPGNYFERGRNAIEEAARKIILMQELTAPDYTYTVNVGTVSGGTVSNKIPDHCSFKVDIRFIREKDRRYLQEQFQQICSQTFIDGTATEIHSNGVLPPFEPHEKEEALYRYLVHVAEKYGLKVPEKQILGGASDAAHISQTDTPVLCAMGVCGENNHSPAEYADTDSFLERAELLLRAVLDQDAFSL